MTEIDHPHEAFAAVIGTFASPDDVHRVEAALDAAEIPFRVRINPPGLAGSYFSIQTTDILVRASDEERALDVVE